MAGKQYGQNMVVAKPLITSPSMQPVSNHYTITSNSHDSL